MAVTPANATINALLGSSIGRFPVGYTGDTTSDMVGINLGMPGTYEGDVTFENLGTPGTYEGDVEFENLGTPPWINPLIPPPLPPASFSIPRGPTLRGYIPGGRTGLERIGEQWTGLSPEIEARIQQDQRRGLFDVNERSVAQLGPLTGTPKLIVDALKEGELRGDPVDMKRGLADYQRHQARLNAEKLKMQRFFMGKGGLTGLGLAAGLYSGRAEAPTAVPRRVFDAGRVSSLGKELHMTPVHFTDEDSPFSWRNAGPAALSQYTRYLDDPGDMWKEFQSFRDQRRQGVREEAGIGAIEGEAEKTRQGLSSTWDVAKRFFGNYLPARRPDPGVPDESIWDPSKEQVPSGTPEELYKQRNDLEEMRFRGASIPPDFRVNARSLASLSPTPIVTYNPPPISREQEIENMMAQDRIEQLPYLPGGSLYMENLGYEKGTGPIKEFEPSDIRLIERGRTVKPEDIRMVGDQALLPGETVVPLPAAPAPYVEQFEAFTPEQEPPQIRKVKKPKVKKAKVKKPKKAKPTRTQLKAKAVKERKSRKSFESAVAKALRETPTVFRGGPPSVSSVKSKARKKAAAKSFAFEDVKARARRRR